MFEEAPNNQRIAKNTVFMYIRMLFVMLLSLYTVRIVLSVLGEEDYGIYNVVAGFVSVIAFVSNSLQSATQRFYAYALGEKNHDQLKPIFNHFLLIFIMLALLVVILGETVGLWFVNHKMTIPEDRIYAANWVYQLALLSFVITIIAIPFSSLLVAHEKISVYAAISVLDCVLKLLIVFLLKVCPNDKLIWYGIWMLIVTLIKEITYYWYSRSKYEECRYKRCWDKNLFKSILSYSGWSLFGSCSNVANDQGNNVLINMFFGAIANASRAVSFQVSMALSSFSANFFIVMRPPIIKSYADKNYSYMMTLFYSSSKFSYYLIYMLFIPLFLETDYILDLWLVDVGDQMVLFTRLALIYSVILTQNLPITTMVQATGKVKRYFSIVEFFTLLSLPLTYLFFKLGYPAEYTFYVSIGVFFMAHIIRVIVMRSLISFFSIKEYLLRFIMPAILVTLLSAILPVYLHYHIDPAIWRLLSVIAAALVSVLLIALFVGMNKKERGLLFDMVGKQFHSKTGRAKTT